MAVTLHRASRKVGHLCRSVAALLIAAVFRSKSFAEVEEDLRNRTISQQVSTTLAVLGLLLVLSIGAAQFGWIGLLIFWLLIVVLVN